MKDRGTKLPIKFLCPQCHMNNQLHRSAQCTKERIKKEKERKKTHTNTQVYHNTIPPHVTAQCHMHSHSYTCSTKQEARMVCREIANN